MALMANPVLRENAIPVVVRPWAILGRLSQPGLPATIKAYIDSGVTRPEDWLVLEDAGDHNEDPTAYQAALQEVLGAAAGLQCVCTTIPDYPPAPPGCQFDRQIHGMSINQAVQAAAAARSVPVIDMNSIMDAYKAACAENDRVDVFHPDGIHPNVWGQMKWIGAILSFIGVAKSIRSYESLKSQVSSNYASLAYGGSMDAAKAQSYCKAILG
jgi:hypothetical protein